MHSVTILIPALNEAGNIENTYFKVKHSVNDLSLEHEIIIVDDGSTDGTGEIAEKIKAQDPYVLVWHNPTPKGIGHGYKKGYNHSEKEFFMLIPGDDDFEDSQIKLILEHIGGKEDIIIPFNKGMKNRPFKRQILSKLFTGALNFLFNLKVPYYNSLALHKTSCLKNLHIRSNGFSYQAEILVKLIKLKNCTFRPVAISTRERTAGESKALSLSNFLDVGKFIIFLVYDIYIKPAPLNPKAL